MEKQERRKRIMSRGSDRLALITGQIQSLDPDPIAKCTSFSIPPPTSPKQQHVRCSSVPFTTNAEDLFQDDRSRGGGNAQNTVTRCDNNEANSKEKNSKAADSVTRASSAQKLQELTVTSSNNANVLTKQFDYLLGSISFKEINFSIISTEDTRAICSAALAILVVLSHVNLRSNSDGKAKSLITFRPLYLVLLTDLFIVALSLAPYAVTKKEENEQKIDEDQDWGGAFKLLEVGLVLHQMVRALFIDCSVYLLIVVCGLSVV